MKNWIIVLIIFTIPLALYAYLGNRATALSYNVTGNAAGVSKARMIKFSSPMCSECQDIAVEIEKAMEKFNGEIVLEEYNVLDTYSKGNNPVKEAVKKYQITLVPTLIFVDKNGKIVQRQEGLMPSDEILRILDTIK